MDARTPDPVHPTPQLDHLLADLDATRRSMLRLSAESAHTQQVHAALIAAHDALQTAYTALAADHVQIRSQAQTTADALRASDARFHATFERAPVGIAHVAPDGQWLRVNQRFCDLVGYSRAQVYARSFQELTHPDDLPSSWATAERLIAGDIPLATLERRYVHRDGSVIWTTLTVSLERTAAGEPDYFIAVMEDITARKAAEADTARSQALLAGIIESAMDAIISIDADQRIVLFNRAAEQIFRISAQVARGRPIHDFLPERFRAVHAEHIQRFAATGATTRSMLAPGTLHALRADGTEVPIEATISHVDVAGEQRFTVIMRDITERSTAERATARLHEQLEQERTLLDAVLQQMPAGVAIVDAGSRRVVLANERLQRTWGISTPPEADIAAYAAAYPLLHGDGRPYQVDERPLARTLHTGTPVRTEEIHFRRGDGTIGTLEANAAPVRDAQGTIIAGVATFRDISVRKRVVAGLHLLVEAGVVLSSALDVDATLQAITQLVVPRLADLCTLTVLRADGELRRTVTRHHDPARQTLLDRLAEDDDQVAGTLLSMGRSAIGTGDAVFYPDWSTADLEADPAAEPYRALIEELAPCSLIAVPLRARDRVLGVLTLLQTDSGRHYDDTELELVKDLASRAALAVDNAQLYEVAQEALRLRDEFLANAGHELRSPLAPLLGACQLLSDRVAKDASLEQTIGRWTDILGQSTKRLRVLVESLIELGQIQSGRASLHPRPLDLAVLVHHVAAEMEAGPKHTIAVMCAEESLPIEADGTRLEHVFTNLLQNAIKYSPHGGKVLVQVERRADHVRVSVRDQGIGIPEAEQVRLFTRFFRASNTTGQNGLGIGLYLVHDIVARHGGSIAVQSTVGQGTTVTVWLPLRARAKQGQAPAG